ncbi:MAG: NADH-quinone oxidoreductase subunit L [Acidimicrobiia bacterium]
MPIDPDLPLWHAALLVLPAAVFALAAAFARRAPSPRAAWRAAGAAGAANLLVAAAVAVVQLAGGAGHGALVRSDAPGAIMLGLVAFVGWVVIRYSRTYLAGDPHQRHATHRLLATLAAVMVVVVANHLLVLVAAWVAASLSMHGLLTFYRERPEAIAAAHKKFLFARASDLCLVGAAALLGLAFGTLRLDHLAAEAAAGGLPAGGRVAMGLVAVAVLLRTAQLPFHGWLIQVMEAPTPVSALLHAGVVNLGGFVLLQLAPLVDAAPEARVLLVAVGTTTAVVAGLVMTTRISIKFDLAWSTCAQMGFMIMQAGLGLWSMVLLHLVAHSLYKAHSFLSAGGVVQQVQRKQRVPAIRPTPLGMVAAALVSFAAVAGVVAVWSSLLLSKTPSAAMVVLLGVVALALVTPLAQRRVDRPAAVLALVATAAGVPLTYLALHELAGRVVEDGRGAPMALLAFVGAAFALLSAVHWWRTLAPAGRLATALYPWLYGGLFLDEVVTRRLFERWPPPAAGARPAVRPVGIRSSVDVRPAPGAPAPSRSTITATSHGNPLPDRSFA